MNRKLSVVVLVVSLCVAAYFVAGAALSRAQDDSEDVPFRQMNVYQEVLEYINNDYVTTPDLHAVTAGALHGLLSSLDADSSYMDPGEYQAFEASEREPAKGQVGVVVSKRAGYAAVIDVRPNGPAARAGLERGDFLEEIGGQSTRDLSLPEIRSLLAGAPGSTVETSAVLLHRTEPKTIDLTRADLPPLPIGQQIDDGTIGYIEVPDLESGRASQIAAAIQALTRKGAQKFILDLRNCGSGDYGEAEKTANLFIDHGTLTYIEGQKYPRMTVTAQANRFLTHDPLAVLVNAGTYGPAEVTAAAILGNGRGDVVGDKTFGEGSVQQVLPLEDGAAVLLSVARYYAPDAKVIAGQGVTPNVPQVQYAGALPQEDLPTPGVTPPGQDLQLARALAMLAGHKTAACRPRSGGLARGAQQMVSVRSEPRTRSAVAGTL